MRETRAFYFTCFLLVTGFCFLLFSLLLAIVEEGNIQLFFQIGLLTFIPGLISGAIYLNRERKTGRRSVSREP